MKTKEDVLDYTRLSTIRFWIENYFKQYPVEPTKADFEEFKAHATQKGNFIGIMEYSEETMRIPVLKRFCIEKRGFPFVEFMREKLTPDEFTLFRNMYVFWSQPLFAD